MIRNFPNQSKANSSECISRRHTAELSAKFIATLLFRAKKITKKENNECLICLSVRICYVHRPKKIIITTTDCEEM